MPQRSARCRWLRFILPIKSFLPTIKPACGPPRILSPLNVTTLGAGLNSFRDDRLFRQAVPAEIDKCAAAEIFHHRQVVLFADGDQLFERHFGGEADDFIIARVDFEQQRGFFVDGIFVIRRMGAIGGAHFAQNRRRSWP